MSKNCREWIIADWHYNGSYVSVPFFPNLKSHEIKNLLEFGDVKALFMGKVEDWDEIKNGVDNEMPVIHFHIMRVIQIDRGYQWNDFINQFEAQKENYHPNIDDI